MLTSNRLLTGCLYPENLYHQILFGSVQNPTPLAFVFITAFFGLVNRTLSTLQVNR